MLPVKKNPVGFRYLRTWQQAKEILEITEKLTSTFPERHPLTGQYLTDLIDQMVRSARSVVRNIEEGFARNTTNEYIQFLGYSYGSLQELTGDYEYCLKGSIGGRIWADKGYYLCKGEAKMLTAQIAGLERKMIQEKTVSPNELARRYAVEKAKQDKAADTWLQKVVEEDRKKR